MSDDLFSLFGFAFAKPKEVKPVLTVDLASDIPAQAFIRALADAGLTIVEQQDRGGRLMICKAQPRPDRTYEISFEPGGKKLRRKPTRGN